MVGDFAAANAMFCWWFTGCAEKDCWDRSDTAAATRLLSLGFLSNSFSCYRNFDFTE